MEPRLQLLAEVYRLIWSKGWKQGGNENKDGPNGLLSTLVVATGSESAHKLSHYRELLAELKARIQATSNYNNTVDWNDAPERTKDDVLGLLLDIYHDWIQGTTHECICPRCRKTEAETKIGA